MNLKSLKTAPRLDGIIRQGSRKVFDLKNDQRIILYILGRDGPANEYELVKKSKIEKTTLVRMIRGRETNSKSLLNQGYVVESLDTQFAIAKGEKGYEHLLTVKGLLASFNNPSNWKELKFEDHYLMHKIKTIILRLSDGNNTLADISILFMKYDAALFMAWHEVNKVPLSIIDELYIYFENWNSTNTLLNPKSFYPTTNHDKLHDALVNLRDEFFAVSYALDAMLKKEKRGRLILQYIKKWVRLTEVLREKYYDSSPPYPTRLQPSPFEGKFVKPEKIILMAKQMLKGSGIDSPRLSKTIPSILQR